MEIYFKYFRMRVKHFKIMSMIRTLRIMNILQFNSVFIKIQLDFFLKIKSNHQANN